MRMFISYTLRDKVLTPLLLADLEVLLSQIGTPYIDILHNNSSHPQQHVMQRLNEASIFIACVTPLFYQSEWVRLEYTTACKLGLPIVTLDCWSLASSDKPKQLRSNNEVAALLKRTYNFHRKDRTSRNRVSASLPVKFNQRTL